MVSSLRFFVTKKLRVGQGGVTWNVRTKSFFGSSDQKKELLGKDTKLLTLVIKYHCYNSADSGVRSEKLPHVPSYPALTVVISYLNDIISASQRYY